MQKKQEKTQINEKGDLDSDRDTDGEEKKADVSFPDVN